MDLATRTRRRTGLVAALSCLVVAAGCRGGEPALGPRPDILLISLDTLRADRLSCYGYERATSPVIDGFAAEGVRFANVHAPSSNTTPSHMSMFTGLDPMAHAVHPTRAANKVGQTLSAQIPTLPELLRDAGYQTASFSDRGGLPAAVGFGRGFDHVHSRWEPLRQKVATAAQWLRGADPERPLFLFFHTYEIHSPYLPPDGFHGRFVDPAYDGPFRERYDELARLDLKSAWDKKGQFLAGWAGLSKLDAAFASALYDEGIAYADDRLRVLWQQWSRERDADDTLLILLSDHGEEFLEHKNLGHRLSVHAELVRVPLIVRGPGVGRGVVETPVSLTGLLPTVLDLLQLDGPAGQFPSFAPLVRDPTAELDAGPVYTQMDSKLNWRFEAVADGDLRLLRVTHFDDVRLELYDWSADPEEQRDLAAERPADVERLGALLDRRLERNQALQQHFRPGGELVLSDEELRELEALGYAGDG